MVAASHLPSFIEALVEINFTVNDDSKRLSGHIVAPDEGLEALYQGVMLGIRDYVQKNGFQGVVWDYLRTDSALVATLAVDALGADRVQAIMMPSPSQVKQVLMMQNSLLLIWAFI